MANMDEVANLDEASGLFTRMENLKAQLKMKENRERFEEIELELTEVTGNYDAEVERLLPEVFFVVSTTVNVDVLAQMKRLGWHGKVEVAGGLPKWLKESIQAKLAKARIYIQK